MEDNSTCMLCCLVEPYVGLAQCSHGPICYKCSYKMRLISKNSTCPICKAESKTILIVAESGDFGSYDTKKMLNNRAYPGFLFESNRSMELFEKLTEYRCISEDCKDDKTFSSIALLKKHMKERHNRYFCDICLEYKTCVLDEHRLYSFKALERHMKKGDVDESGNTTFMHPYCKFCNMSFFDEDFLRKHLTRQHYTCTLCPEKYKYYHYKDYKSLETHFRMTHYLCPDQDCIAKGFVAYKTQSDLLAHRVLVHAKNDSNEKKPTDLTAVAGFYTEGSKLQMEHMKLEDKEGIDFEMEFLSLRKTKMRAISDEVDQHKDEEFDFRIFMKQELDDDELFAQAFEGKAKERDNDTRKDNKDKKKYKLKGEQTQPQQQANDSKPDQQQTVYMQNVLAARTVHSTPLQYKEFEQKLHMIFDQEQYDKFSKMKHEYFKNKLSAADFMEGYLRLFRPAALRTAYNVWPQFIRTVQNQQTKYELDAVYLKSLKTALPKKINSLITSSKKYSDLLNSLLEIIEGQLRKRIEEGSLNIRKKVKMDKERIFQMIEVIRHIKTSEMARLKFGTNFGINPETIHMLETELYFVNIKDACAKLNGISEFQLFNLYLFVKFCRNALTKKDIHLEKRLIKEEILEDFLERNPDLLMKYGKRKESMTLEEQAEYEEEQEKKVKQKTLMKLGGFQKKVMIVDHEDKYDFPDLNDKKVETKKTEVDKATMPITNEQYKQTFVYETANKPAVMKKNINEFFPSLGSEPKKTEPVKTEPARPETASTARPETDKSKPWWTQVEGKNEQQPEDGKLQGEIRREKKKKKQIVYIQGGFK